MSAESGLPTFRGSGGLWRGVRVEEVATPDAFARDPKFVWTWYRERILEHARARPHAGHRALVDLEKTFGGLTIATQNVDALHERAGSRSVLHLHGALTHARCTGCGVRSSVTKTLLRVLPPSCAACGLLLRPDVVWFGEPLPEGALTEASGAAGACDVAVVIGTSNLVHPAATLPAIARLGGARTIEVNVETTPLTADVDVHLGGPASEVLPALVRALKARRSPNKTRR